MSRIALIALALGIGLMVAPGVAQSTGLGSSVAEDLDPVGNAEAHYDSECIKGPCVCYFGPGTPGYHCHAG